MTPSHDILSLFGVRLIAPLGGRINQHWLVEAHGDQLVLRYWGQSPLVDSATSHDESINYELRLVASLAALEWPVAPLIAGPAELNGQTWSLSPFLPGEVPAMDRTIHGPREEQRARGRLLAEFHAGLAQVPALGQRPGWRRCEEVLADPTLDDAFSENERERPEEVRVLRWHLERARERITELQPGSWPGGVVHGDFTPWNLRYTNGRLSGILDFELAHWDHRIGDFVLAWRGKYDDVVLGYAEVSPLQPEEWALITPLWWTQLIFLACVDMKASVRDDGWIISKLLLRSPLMGKDAAEYRA